MRKYRRKQISELKRIAIFLKKKKVIDEEHYRRYMGRLIKDIRSGENLLPWMPHAQKLKQQVDSIIQNKQKAFLYCKLPKDSVIGMYSRKVLKGEI